MTKYTDQQYLDYDPFFGEEGTLALHVKKLKKARKEHSCFLSLAYGGTPHNILPGQRYRFESALVDGDYFGKYAMCLDCLDKELDMLYNNDEDEKD